MRAINVEILNRKLVEQPDNIIKILVALGYDANYIVYHKNKHMITSRRRDGDNNHGTIIYTNSLCVLETTRSWNGNLFALVMKERGCNFPQALKYTAKCLGINVNAAVKIHLPFSAFYKDIIRDDDRPEYNLKTYDEECLSSMSDLSYNFIKDGISLETQEEWGVRYSHEEDSVLIPIRDISGHLVGCKARNNNMSCPNDKRWYAYLPYSKTCVVYGLDKNYLDIISKRTLFIFEAEKSVLQLASNGFNYACAIGGHNLSEAQCRLIKNLLIDRIIICFDSDICEEEIVYNAKKLRVDNRLLHNKVGYIYGGLDKTSKASPSDYGLSTFRKLVKNNIKYLD